MKNRILTLVTLFFFYLSSFAQTNVTFNIHHKLGDADFAFNKAAQNNIGQDFRTNRLEYYISEITLIHDGGQETGVKNRWLLIDAVETTSEELGSFEITDLEGIRFHIGVDSAHNHLDPTSWPSDHPLAPQAPSMHWGWAAGYRFLAFEAESGPAYNQPLELHSLGNQNYFAVELAFSKTAADDQLAIDLDADYSRALEDMEINSGTIVHGDFGEAQQALENFRDYVFSPSPSPTSTRDLFTPDRFEIFPNPVSNGTATLTLQTEKAITYSLQVTDLMGRIVQQREDIPGNINLTLDFPQPGVFFVNLAREGQVVDFQKIIVQ
jgi:hypothetical protein